MTTPFNQQMLLEGMHERLLGPFCLCVGLVLLYLASSYAYISTGNTQSKMFYGATAYDQPIDRWKFSSGTHFDKMFEGSSFTGAIPEFYELIPTRKVLDDLLLEYSTNSYWSSSDEAIQYGYVNMVSIFLCSWKR